MRSALVMCVALAFGGSCGRANTGTPDRRAAVSHPASPASTAVAAPSADVDALERSASVDDRVRAVALREKACATGDTKSCFVLAEALMTGSFVEPDPWRAAELLASACAQKNGDACYELADLYENGLAVDKDRAKAEALRTRACELEQVWACDKTSNAQRAFDIELARCERGEASACFDADVFKSRGGVKGEISKQTWQQVRETLERECGKGLGKSCLDLAFVFRRSFGGQTADDDVQRDLEIKACELGYVGACGRRMYWEKDVATLDKLGRRGCDLGEAESCRRLGKLSSDPAQSLELYRRACALRDLEGCEMAAVALKKTGDRNGERTIRTQLCAVDRSTCLELARDAETSGDRTAALLHFARACADGKLALGCAGELRILHAACVAGDQASCERKTKRLAMIQKSKRDIVAWICCHLPDAMPDTPAAAVVAIASAVLASDETRLRALVHPTLGLSVRDESSFDGNSKLFKTKVRAASATPGQLTSTVYENHDAIDCTDVVDGRASCTVSDPIGFSATYKIRIENERAYVVAIDAQSWGHS